MYATQNYTTCQYITFTQLRITMTVINENKESHETHASI